MQAVIPLYFNTPGHHGGGGTAAVVTTIVVLALIAVATVAIRVAMSRRK